MVGWSFGEDRMGRKKVRVGKVAERTRVRQTPWLFAGFGAPQISPGRKQETHKGAQPGSHSSRASAVSTTQWLTGQCRGLQSHLLTEGCRTRNSFFPLKYSFFPTLSMELRGFLKHTPQSVWAVQSGSCTQHENCFPLPVWYVLFSIGSVQILPHI